MKQLISVWKPKKNGGMKMKWKKRKVSPMSHLSKEAHVEHHMSNMEKA